MTKHRASTHKGTRSGILGSAAMFANSAIAMAIVSVPVAAQEPVVLDVTYSGGLYTSVMEETAASFEAANPDIDIRLRRAFESHGDHLQATLRDAATGSIADVGFHGNHLVSVLVAREIAQPIDRLLENEDAESLGYTAAVPAIARFGEYLYGLPWQISAPVVFYNADLVRDAGADPDRLPETWPEIVSLAERIEAAQPDAMGGFFDYLTNGNWTFQVLINSQGGRMMSEGDEAIAFAGPEGVWALQVLHDFGQRAGMTDMTQSQSQQAFAGGAIGVYPSYSSLLGRIEEAAEGQFEVRTGPWPVPADGGRVPAGGRTVVIQTADEQTQQAAWSYVKYMTGPEVQTMLVRQIGAVPANMLVVERDEYLAEYYAETPNARAGVAMLDYFTTWYSFPGGNSVRIVDTIREHLRTVATGQNQPDDAMANMVADVQALLPRD